MHRRRNSFPAADGDRWSKAALAVHKQPAHNGGTILPGHRHSGRHYRYRITDGSYPTSHIQYWRSPKSPECVPTHTPALPFWSNPEPVDFWPSQEFSREPGWPSQDEPGTNQNQEKSFLALSRCRTSFPVCLLRSPDTVIHRVTFLH